MRHEVAGIKPLFWYQKCTIFLCACNWLCRKRLILNLVFGDGVAHPMECLKFVSVLPDLILFNRRADQLRGFIIVVLTRKHRVATPIILAHITAVFISHQVHRCISNHDRVIVVVGPRLIHYLNWLALILLRNRRLFLYLWSLIGLFHLVLLYLVRLSHKSRRPVPDDLEEEELYTDERKDQCVVECQKRILLRIAVKEVCVGHIVQDPAPSLNIELAFLAELAPIEVSVE